jgi:hypothetical protein
METPASPQPQNASRALIAALLIGFSVDFLFYSKPLGLSFPLFVAFSASLLLLLAVLERAWPALSSLWLSIPIGAFAALVYVRAEPLTTFVNVAMTLALGVLWARTFYHGQLFRFGLLDYAVNFLLAGIDGVLFPPSIILAAGKEATAQGGSRRLVLPVLRGLLLALPVVLLFAALLGAADLVFADRLRDLLEALNLDNIPELIWRSGLIIVMAFGALGLMAQALWPASRYSPIGAGKSLVPHFLGLIESSIVLGSINLLFAAFVVIQFRYLFGNTANISEAGYTYSEYARRGFGELVIVVAITLLILLALSTVTRREGRTGMGLFNLLSVIAVGLVGVMVVSALQRLLLYEAIYGFTRLRTYSHVAIVWLGILFVPYLIALLAGRLRWFAPGALLVVIGFAATLNALNVDRFIARQNIHYYRQIGQLHTAYLVTLSDDVLPELVPLLQGGDPEVVAVLGPGLACRAAQLRGGYAKTGWQSTQLAHQSALEMLNAEPSLVRWAVYKSGEFPYEDFVYVKGERITCNSLLASFVLEPGLTREYR